MAKIICLLKRTGGTKVELFGKKFHFKPDPADKSEDPVHVCEVEDAACIHRFLKIKEAYTLLDPEEDLPPPPKPDPAHAQTIAGDATKKPEAKPIIISNGEEEVNLSEMDLEPLRAFAKSAFNITCHHKWPKATIIAKIVEANRGE